MRAGEMPCARGRHPRRRRCPGVQIAFDELAQGRGHGRLAQRVVLERMIELGVRVFNGAPPGEPLDYRVL